MQNPTEPDNSNSLTQLLSSTYFTSSKDSMSALIRMYKIAITRRITQCRSIDYKGCCTEIFVGYAAAAYFAQPPDVQEQK